MERALAAPAERRIHAYADLPLILTLTRADPSAPNPDRDRGGGEIASWRPARAPIVRYASGAPARARMVYFEAQPGADGGSGWLPKPPKWVVVDWEATAASDWRPNHPGFWALIIPPPPPPTPAQSPAPSPGPAPIPAQPLTPPWRIGGAGGAGGGRGEGGGEIVRFDGAALPIVWLANPPATTDSSRAPRLDLSRAALVDLGEQIEGWAADPILGWRVSVLRDRMRGLPNRRGEPASEPEDPALTLLAAVSERRWRSALAVLENDDPELASEVIARATAVISLPGRNTEAGVAAWPLDTSALESLKMALLNPGSTKDARVLAARAWLESVPPALVWITEESEGAMEEGTAGERLIRVAMANLTRGRVIASTAAEGRASVNAARLEGHRSAEFTCLLDGSAPGEEGGPAGSSGRVVARAGGWSEALAALPVKYRAAPPGLLLGPLWPELNLADLYAAPTLRRMGVEVGRRSGADARQACVAMLLRRPRGPGTEEAWEVYIECNGATESDEVTIWFGPPGAEALASRLGPGAGDSGARERPAMTITREGDHWWSVVPVPTEAIGPNRRLPISISRAQAGRRWSWPRPFGPGQVEPSRGVVDLSSWSLETDE